MYLAMWVLPELWQRISTCRPDKLLSSRRKRDGSIIGRLICYGSATANSKPLKGSLLMYYENPDGVSVHDGFPNPAVDTSLQTLDLNSLLITHTATTYLMRLAGDEWQQLGIFDGDILIVDRSLSPRPNDLAVWAQQERFVITRKHEVSEGSPVWGIVSSVIHVFRKAGK